MLSWTPAACLVQGVYIRVSTMLWRCGFTFTLTALGLCATEAKSVRDAAPAPDAPADARSGSAHAKLQLATTLTFADPDTVWEDHSDPVWVPELGTALRTALENEIADGLHEIIGAWIEDAAATSVAAGVRSVEIASIEQGRMDAHGPPVYYAFVEVVLTVDVHANEACLSADQLLHGKLCAEPANAIADTMKAASSVLWEALYKGELAVRFTESGEDGFSGAEPRASDFELLVDGQRLTSRELRHAATT
jgi:hypothetical protein